MTNLITPSASQTAAAAAAASASGFGHLAVLLSAVQDGIINLLIPARATIPSKRDLRRCDTPAIALVGDDDFRPTGPTGWACSSGLQGWATHAIIHGASATLGQYRNAVSAALTVRKLVLVETSSSQLQPWEAAFTEAKPVRVSLVAVRVAGIPNAS